MRYKIYNEDCLDFLNTIEENSIDMIFVDLPYVTCNRRFIGIEKDEQYFEIAKNRIENEHK